MAPDDDKQRYQLTVPLDAALARRLRALAAERDEPLEMLVRAHLEAWLGDWGQRVATHAVRPGETLWSIARRYYGDGRRANVLAAYNAVEDPTLLGEGDVVLVPEPDVSDAVPPGESPYLHGLEDRGGEYLMERAGKPGWVLLGQDLAAEPPDAIGRSYEDLAERGFGVIVRLEHGPGTLPPADRYEEFARRSGAYARRSEGCHVWVIGDAPNRAASRPGGARDGAPITPEDYARAYYLCREDIRSQPGHADDRVLTAAIAPWNTQTRYPGNPNGDWVLYFADVLALLEGHLDGLALHAIARDPDPARIAADDREPPPHGGRRAGFRAFQDFLAAVPEALRGLPAYITSAGPDLPWAQAGRGWVQAAYAEVARWNLTNQPIRCMILHRWQPRPPGAWHLEGQREAVADLEAAIRQGHRRDGWHRTTER